MGLTSSRTPATQNVSKWVDALYCSRSRGTHLRHTLSHVQKLAYDKYRVEDADLTAEWNRMGDLAQTFGYEVFSRLYDRGSVEELERTAPDTGWMSLAHELIEGLPAIAGTEGDPDLSAIATSKLMEAMLPAMEALMDQDVEDGDGEGGAGGTASGSSSGGSPVSGSDVARALLRKATEEVNEEVQQMKEALNTIEAGLGEAPAQQDEADLSRINLAQRLISNESIKKAIELAGTMKRHMQSERNRKDPQGKSHVYGLEIGNDLPRVLPQELANLRHPKLRMLTLGRFAERTLTQYKLEGKEPQGRGPVIVLLDSSASMRSESSHSVSCYVYATAMAIALVGIGAKEGRPVTVISFNRCIVWEARVDANGNASWLDKGSSFKPTEAPLAGIGELVLNIAQTGPCGGTDFGRPLERALKMRDGAGDDKSDLILITDGDANVPVKQQEPLAKAKEGGMKMWGFTVGGGSLGASVRTLCDTTLDIDSASDEAVGKALA
jgi:hypothetical protein